MEIAAFSDPLAWLQVLPHSVLMWATVGAIGLSMAGSLVSRRSPALGHLMRGASTVSLLGILLLVVAQLARVDSRFDVALPQAGLPRQVVAGDETHIPLAPDGHYWVSAQVNGQPVDFMVDTGATLTAISSETADQIGLEPRPGGLPVQLTTANGPVTAQLATIDTLEFGNVRASGLDAVIAPNLGRMNVIGMNVLSRLGSWRVEGTTMIMVPKGEAAGEGS
jgi:aspartyl protease family protein